MPSRCPRRSRKRRAIGRISRAWGVLTDGDGRGAVSFGSTYGVSTCRLWSAPCIRRVRGRWCLVELSGSPSVILRGARSPGTPRGSAQGRQHEPARFFSCSQEARLAIYRAPGPEPEHLRPDTMMFREFAVRKKISGQEELSGRPARHTHWLAIPTSARGGPTSLGVSLLRPGTPLAGLRPPV